VIEGVSSGAEAGKRGASDESLGAGRNKGMSTKPREVAETGGNLKTGGRGGVGEMSEKWMAWIVGLGDKDSVDVKLVGEHNERG
jgi:hypothetical protein